MPQLVKGSLRQSKPHAERALREEVAGLLATLGISRMVEHYADNPQALSEQIWHQFIENPTIQRTINQFAEQVIADADIVPEARNETIAKAIKDYWAARKLPLQLPSLFKAFLISGEHWCFIPTTDKGYPMRFLTPWLVSSIKGLGGFDWQEATYTGVDKGQARKLTPDTTAYYAHDALFNNLRGTPPFSALYFAAIRHKRYLELRERVVRVAAMVTGELNFETIGDAAAVLGWQTDPQTNLPIPEVVNVPEDGTLVVTVGNSKFTLGGNTVANAGGDSDGKAFKQEATEATRLPEFMNGNGGNVSVATAKVQFPVAMRAIMSLRDAFATAVTQDLRLLLRRMVDGGLIAKQWPAKLADGSTVIETPESAVFLFNFPESSEIDYDGFLNAILSLYDRGLFLPDEVVKAAGYDPEAVLPDPTTPLPGKPGADTEGVRLSRADLEAAVKSVLDAALQG